MKRDVVVKNTRSCIQRPWTAIYR